MAASISASAARPLGSRSTSTSKSGGWSGVTQSGDTPTQLLADAGYCSDVNLAAIADTPIDAYISTRKRTHDERFGPCPRGALPKTATRVDRMACRLRTKAGAAVYATRKAIVELPSQGARTGRQDGYLSRYSDGLLGLETV